MESLKRIISFIESRINSTEKIIEHLNNAIKTNMATDLVHRELEMQYGELEMFQNNLDYLKELQTKKD